MYTYNDYIAATASMDWNPHTWETHDDGVLLERISMGFYDLVLNADKTGYAFMPEMAAELPVDVTAEYVGKFGVAEGETAKAFRIALNKDATWENGEKITADDYIYSMQQQLNPKMLNRRADSYYAGEMIIYNAKNYLYAGKTTTRESGFRVQAVFVNADHRSALGGNGFPGHGFGPLGNRDLKTNGVRGQY